MTCKSSFCFAIAMVVYALCLVNIVSAQPSCDASNFLATVNYTDQFVFDVINTLGGNPNSRPLVQDSPWMATADFTYKMYWSGGSVYIARKYQENYIYGGNNTHNNNTRYTVLIAGKPTDWMNAKVYVQDIYGSCLINGVPYNNPFIPLEPMLPAYCDYINFEGDLGAYEFECYSATSSPVSGRYKGRLNSNLPSVWRFMDQKFGLTNLPTCTPLHEVIHYGNSTANKYRVISNLFFNVQPELYDPVTISSTCSNFPTPDAEYLPADINDGGSRHVSPLTIQSRIRARNQALRAAIQDKVKYF